MRADCDWWLEHLDLMNGRAMAVVGSEVPAAVLPVFIDARGGDGGVGVFVDGGFVGLTGPEVNARYPELSPGVRRALSGSRVANPSGEANHWEMMAFVVLLDAFPEVLRGRHVVVHSDSVTAVRCVRTLSAALESPPLAHLTRAFLGRCVRLGTRVRPVHVPGDENVLADPLSRGARELGRFGRVAAAWVADRHGQQSAFLRYLGRGECV